MAAPGSYTDVSTARTGTGAPTGTEQSAWALLTERGPTVPTLIQGEDAFASTFGADTSYTNAFTYAQGFFRAGGRRLWVKRLTGPTPTKASITFNGSGATPSVKFEANDYGAYAHDIRGAFVAGLVSGVRAQISSASGAFTTLTSSDLTTKAEVLAYTGFSGHGVWTSAGAGTLPVTVAAAALSGGTDDNASLTDPIRAAGLLELTGRGPAQFALPGDTRSAAAVLLNAAVAANPTRGLGVFDAPDDVSAGTVAAAAAACGDLPLVAMYGPWLSAPPLVTGGAARSIPPSAAVAGVMARQDRVTGNPNRPAAGDRGIVPWVTGVNATWTDAERDTLNTAGMNVIRDRDDDGVIRIFGIRTLANPTTQPLFLQAANVRLDAAILADGKAICDPYVFEQFDGKGVSAANLANELTGMLSGWLALGALTPLIDQDTGVILDPRGYVVHTPTITVVDGVGSVEAPIELRRSPSAEMVTLRVTVNSTTEAFA